MGLKNKLSEEDKVSEKWAKEFIGDMYSGTAVPCQSSVDICIKNLRSNNRIRKSAREELDEYIESIKDITLKNETCDDGPWMIVDNLKLRQLRAAERAERE